MSQDKKIYIIVLAWNHIEDTLECLESIMMSTCPSLNLVLVDNASTDGTPQIVQERYPQLKVIQSPTNLGVTGGYNLGLEYAAAQGADQVLIANNDISVNPDMISMLSASLDADPHAGIAMPKIYHYYGDRSRIWMIGGRWRKFPPSVKTIGQNAPDADYCRPLILDYVPSCCFMLRGEALRKVGGFDTGYFFYYDDWDYSVRMRKAGYAIHFVPEAKMWHKVSISTQKSDKPAKWWGYFGKSTVRFYTHHAKPWQLQVFTAWFLIRETIKGKPSHIRPFLEGAREERSQARMSAV